MKGKWSVISSRKARRREEWQWGGMRGGEKAHWSRLVRNREGGGGLVCLCVRERLVWRPSSARFCQVRALW